EAETYGEPTQEALGELRRRGGRRCRDRQAPEWLAVAAPVETIDPARQRFPRVPLALAVGDEAVGREPRAQPLEERRREPLLRRALGGEEARRRVEPDPAGAGNEDLSPGVQVGEIALGAGGTVERAHVGPELDQVPGDEARGEAEVAQALHQEPAAVTTGARAAGE